MSLEERLEELADALHEILAEDFEINLVSGYNELTLEIPRIAVLPVMKRLRDYADCQFDQCIDICAVDLSTYGQSEWRTQNDGFSRAARRDMFNPAPESRFAVVYHLLSLHKNLRLRVKTLLDSDFPVVDSVVSLWDAANWFEREAFDLFGVLFQGHPDLRRILTDYGFIGHPFRKDFPLEGTVEMRYDSEQKRVIYQPVSIEPRTLVPRVIRDDNRYEPGWKPTAAEQGADV